MAEHPHVPAAFINTIREEGTKAEAIDWLQKTWNERCTLSARVAQLEEALRLHVEYEKLPSDRGGENGPKGRAWQAFITARDAALSEKEARG